MRRGRSAFVKALTANGSCAAALQPRCAIGIHLWLEIRPKPPPCRPLFRAGGCGTLRVAAGGPRRRAQLVAQGQLRAPAEQLQVGSACNSQSAWTFHSSERQVLRLGSYRMQNDTHLVYDKKTCFCTFVRDTILAAPARFFQNSFNMAKEGGYFAVQGICKNQSRAAGNYFRGT